MVNWFKILIIFLSLPAYLWNVMRYIHEGQTNFDTFKEIEFNTLFWTFVWITIPYWLLIGGIGFWFTGTIVYYPFGQ